MFDKNAFFLDFINSGFDMALAQANFFERSVLKQIRDSLISTSMQDVNTLFSEKFAQFNMTLKETGETVVF